MLPRMDLLRWAFPLFHFVTDAIADWRACAKADIKSKRAFPILNKSEEITENEGMIIRWSYVLKSVFSTWLEDMMTR